MKKITTYFFAGLGVALAVFFACFLVDSVQVSADILTYVDLSVEQTLALYGNQISGSYWTGQDYQSCTFNYIGVAPTSNLIFRDGQWSSSEKTYISERQFLIYAMDSSGNNSNSFISPSTRVTLELIPSISISGIDYYRQFIGYSIGQSITDPYTIISQSPDYMPYNFISSIVSFSASPFISNISIYLRENFKWWASYIDSPNYVNWSFFDIYLQYLENGQEQTFDLSNQTLNFSGIKPCTFSFVDGQKSFYYIILSCPRVTDGYILPSVPETTPDYSSQLDSLVTIGGQNSTLLQQILAKLDLIYQKMQQDESSPTLQGPEKIGFDSRTKQEILDGVASADSVLDGVQPSDLPTGASDSIWYFWGRLKNIMPPSLWALYLFALIGGFVGWVLYGKRGG